MNETKTTSTAVLTGWRTHKFFILVAATIAVSVVLVGVAMAIYSNSGAAQLDLSRPGYQAITKEADRNEMINAFPSTGSLDPATLDKFRKLYTTQAQQVLGYDGFGGDPMSDTALGLELNTPPAPPQP